MEQIKKIIQVRHIPKEIYQRYGTQDNFNLFHDISINENKQPYMLVLPSTENNCQEKEGKKASSQELIHIVSGVQVKETYPYKIERGEWIGIGMPPNNIFYKLAEYINCYFDRNSLLIEETPSTEENLGEKKLRIVELSDIEIFPNTVSWLRSKGYVIENIRDLDPVPRIDPEYLRFRSCTNNLYKK